ncbi:MAG: bifunctional DNA primase/helicase, partial [Dolichospermum sp.]
SKPINVSLNQRYLGDIFEGVTSRIVAVKSPKGTGKTESLINQVMSLVNAGYKVFLASHRVQLCQEICRRLNISYIDDLKNNSNGYGFVIDSFHGKGKCQSDIDNDYSFWIDDYVVIIDEVEQFLWHLFDSSTEVKKHRCAVIKQFELLIKNANQVYILDADLTDVSIDYIRAICDDDDINIIKNEYKEGGYKAFIYQSPDA